MPIINPSDIAGLVGWWNTKLNVTVLTSILGWTSREGNSFVMNSSGPGARPMLVSDSGVYERKVVALDGINDRIENLPADTPSIAIATQTPVFIFIVLKYPTISVGTPHIFNCQSATADRIQGSATISVALDALRTTFAPGSAADMTEGTDFDKGDWFVYCMSAPTGIDTGLFDVRIDNTIIDSGGSIGTAIGLNELILGDILNTGFANTRYAEIVIYGGVGVSLTTQNFIDLQDYFAREWFSQPGLGVGIGSGILGEG